MAPSTQLAFNDPNAWTKDALREYLAKPGDGSGPFFRHFFRWSPAEMRDAIAYALAQLDHQGLSINHESRLPPKGTARYSSRVAAESQMVNGKPNLFMPPHLIEPTQQPPWFSPEMLPGQERSQTTYPFETVTQVFIGHAWSTERRSIQKVAKLEESDPKTPKRSRSTSVASSKSRTSSTSAVASVLKRLRVEGTPAANEDETDIFSTPARPPSPPRPPKPELPDITIHICRATIDEDDILTLQLRILSWHGLTDDDGSVDMKRARKVVPIRDNDNFFVFRGSDPWPIDDEFELEGVILELHNNMDTRVNPSGVGVFIADNENIMWRIPEANRNPATQEKKRVTIDLRTSMDEALAQTLQREEEEAAHDTEAVDATDEQLRKEQAEREQAVADEAQKQEERKQAALREAQRKQDSVQAMIDPQLAQFPYMVRYDPEAARLLKAVASTEPTVDLSDLCSGWKMVGWLSSRTIDTATTNQLEEAPDASDPDDPENAPAKQPTIAAEFLQGQIKATHLTPSEWSSACKFFGFDVAETDSRSSVYFDGWNSTLALKAYQFFTVAYVIKQLGKGKDLMIIGLAMGLGKTAIGLATMKILGKLQKKYWTRPVTFGPPVVSQDTAVESIEMTNESSSESANDSSYFNMQKLSGSSFVIRQGVALVVLPLNMLDEWVSERDKFIISKFPKVVIAHETKPFTKEVKATKYRNCHHVLDKVPEEDWPPTEQLLESWSLQQLDRFKQDGGIPLKDFLSPTESGDPEPWHSDWCVFCTEKSVDSWIQSEGSIKTNKQKIDTVWSDRFATW
ncbi:hypothetical protein K431DRAFT_316936 [Polychaeton citri CBS 116435]|uniref:Uncharacterized protein n=1 Tax=Polychaeton citri CBS 116435 TaxID=1314669 RepID=A0A9P4PXW7_9PEZI|nr:hypothetical protein K431DRAFT_316936 [Polychaeton citri CBS 116435]